jgi:glutamate dehydrogenase
MAALFAALDVVEVANGTGQALDDVAALHFLLGGRLHLHWLRDQIATLPLTNRWEAMARAALRDHLFSLHTELSADASPKARPTAPRPRASTPGWPPTPPQSAAAWRSSATSEPAGTYDLTTLPVALREVRNLIQSTAPVSGDGARPATATEAAQAK